MARYTKAKCKLCRTEGLKLFLRGAKCASPECPFTKRILSAKKKIRVAKKPSPYAIQLREKQKVKRIYGILERQFKRYFELAAKTKGITGELMIQLLERRLDNVIYRLLFSVSSPAMPESGKT